jgi:colanic acid/amylovoran biosynthesis glycosyltransferase
MKVAFILNTFPSLSETFILSQITGLIDQGHDVRILAERNPHESVVHADVRAYHLEKRTVYVSTPKGSKHKKRFLFAMRFLSCFLTSPLKATKLFLALIRMKGGFSYSVFYYATYFLKHRYDIIHCHFGTNGHIGVFLKKVGFCRHMIVTFYGYDVSAFVKTRGKHCYDELFDVSDSLLVLSQNMKQRLIELGADEKKIKIHHLGTKPEFFDYKERIYSPKRAVRILSVARLSEKKGLEYSIRAVSKLIQESCRDIQYSIAGEGELRNDLEKIISDAGMQEHIFLLGAKDQAGVKELFDQTDIFLLASVTAENGDQEGTPTVLVEAICCGIPVISTYHSGIPDIITDGESGFLVPEKDIDALKEKLGYLIDHPETWAQMGRKGREHFDKEFNVDVLNQRLENIYYQLLHWE